MIPEGKTIKEKMKKLIKKIWISRLNVPRRIYVYIYRQIIIKFRIHEVSQEYQEKKMEAIGLDRKEAIKTLNIVLQETMDIKYSENYGMFSEHLILIAALSNLGNNIKKILEIGTYDGRTAVIFGRLFPNARVITVDLPITDVTYKDTYGRHNNANKFAEDRDKLLNINENIDFIEMNSLELCNYNEKFDLIWIDGAHGFPIVAMDIINAYRLADNGCYILIDDVWTSADESDEMYKSIGGFKSLNALVEANLIERYHLFPKRLGAVYNCANEKKYVGLFQKRIG